MDTTGHSPEYCKYGLSIKKIRNQNDATPKSSNPFKGAYDNQYMYNQGPR